MSDLEARTSGQGAGHRPAGQQPFFAGGERGTYLEQLRHLSQWSRRLLLVTGPRGAGKSTLYRQLFASLEPRSQAARINGALASGGQEVLNAIAQDFGLAVPADAEADLLTNLIADHVEAQDRSDRFCLVLLDDADLLDNQALAHLAHLSAAAPLRVVLFGEMRLAAAVQRVAVSSGVDWHEIRLGAFAVEDVRGYLEWRFRQQGYTGPLPFSDSQVREITRLSEGLPGRIDQMANVLLAKIQSGGFGGGRRFPTLHLALLGVLLAAIAVAYLVWLPADESAGSDWAAVERLEVPPPERAPASRQEDLPAGDAPQGVPVQDREDPASPPREPDPQPAMDTPADSGSAELVPEAPPVVRAPEPTPPAGETPGVEKPPVEKPPAEKPPAETPAAGRPAVATPPEPAPADSGARDAAWIMRQPPASYTLQLVIFSTDQRATEYLAEQADPASFARFRLQRGGRILHAVIYGVYGSRAEAERAAADLPPAIGDVEPWVRSFGQIQEAVRSALQS